jgi:hypothetical protein
MPMQEAAAQDPVGGAIVGGAAGAIIGGVLGGGRGAAIGAIIGGATPSFQPQYPGVHNNSCCGGNTHVPGTQ